MDCKDEVVGGETSEGCELIGGEEFRVIKGIGEFEEGSIWIP